MPLPKPRSGEDQNDFMGRCMGDETMMQDFPRQDQRVAVCMSQWRRGKDDEGSPRTMKSRDFGMEVKAVDAEGIFEGYASTFGGAPDSYGDVITPGAFAASLAQHRREGTMPMMFFGHQSSSELPIGDWLDLAEDGKGLWGKGRLALDDPMGQRVHLALKDKRVRGLSIGYETRKSRPDEKRPGVTHLDEIHLWEVSIVNFPANRRSLVTEAKNSPDEIARRFREGAPITISEFEEFLREAGFPRSAARHITAKGYAYAIRCEAEGSKSAVETLRAFRAGLGG